MPLDETRTSESRCSASADPRLPLPDRSGSQRYFGAKTSSFGFAKTGSSMAAGCHRSLSSAVREATGTRWNGFAFFGLGSKPGRKRGDDISNGARPKTIRCAIYTRKSTEEGLEQDFNSLDAQREAAEAYILSQTARRLDACCRPLRRRRLYRCQHGAARAEAPAGRHRGGQGRLRGRLQGRSAEPVI